MYQSQTACRVEFFHVSIFILNRAMHNRVFFTTGHKKYTFLWNEKVIIISHVSENGVMCVPRSRKPIMVSFLWLRFSRADVTLHVSYPESNMLATSNATTTVFYSQIVIYSTNILDRNKTNITDHSFKVMWVW